MACTAWHQLLGEWIDASRSYADAVMAANRLRGFKFELANRRVEQARRCCLNAEHALREHERAHGCLVEGAQRARQSA